MVLCPVAIAVGCRKCPLFKVCPVKGVIGDYKEPEAQPGKRASAKASPAKSRSAKSRARRK